MPTKGNLVPDSSEFQIDLAEAQRLLAALAPTADRFCFQTFDDRGIDKSLARTLHGRLHEHVEILAELNAHGAGVFITPNAVASGKPRKTANVVQVRALFVDYDKDKPYAPPLPEFERRIEVFRVKPSVIVESSPGNRHIYWVVDDFPLDADRFKQAQHRLATLFGTDPAVNDLPRVMRLPGFYHRKGEPFFVRIVR